MLVLEINTLREIDKLSKLSTHIAKQMMGFGIVICYIFLPHCALSSIYTTQFGLVFAFSWLISYQFSFCSVLETSKIQKIPEALKENPYNS